MIKGNILFGWNDLVAGQPIKKLTTAFAGAGASVISATSDGKARRTAGISFKTLDITFADSQHIQLLVKQTGDVYEVKLNGQMVPLKNPDDHKKAIKELVAKMDAGRAKYQKKMAMVKVELPKGIKSTAAKQSVVLAARVVELDTAIAEATTKRDALKAEVGGVMDSAVLDAAKKKDGYMAFNVDSAMGKFTVIVKTEKGAAELDAIRDAREAVKSELHGLGSTQVIPGGKVMKSVPDDAWDVKSAKGWAWMMKGNFPALDDATLDAAKPKLAVGDDVHNTKLNKTGSVRKVEGDKVLVRTVSGLDTWDLADVEEVKSFDSIEQDGDMVFDAVKPDASNDAAIKAIYQAAKADYKSYDAKIEEYGGADKFVADVAASFVAYGVAVYKKTKPGKEFIGSAAHILIEGYGKHILGGIALTKIWEVQNQMKIKPLVRAIYDTAWGKGSFAYLEFVNSRKSLSGEYPEAKMPDWAKGAALDSTDEVFDRVSYEQGKSFVFANAVKQDGSKVDLIVLDDLIHELTKKGSVSAGLPRVKTRKEALSVAKESGNYKSVTEGGATFDSVFINPMRSNELVLDSTGQIETLAQLRSEAKKLGLKLKKESFSFGESVSFSSIETPAFTSGSVAFVNDDNRAAHKKFVLDLHGLIERCSPELAGEYKGLKKYAKPVLDGAGNNSTDLDNPAYTTPVKLPGQGKVTAINAHSAADGAKILNKLRPDWTKADHLNMAAEHEDLAESAETDWGSLVSSEFKKLFGRDYRVGDYKVSGVARSEFPDDVKDKLRELNRQMNGHKSLRVAHAYAAKHYGKGEAALDYAGQPRDTDGTFASGKKNSIKAGANHLRIAVKRAFSNPFRK